MPKNNQIIKNIKNRRSIRSYKGKSVPRGIIKEIIEAGRYAPSSHNSQPWRFIVITNRKKIKELSESVKDYYRRLVRLGAILTAFSRKLRKLSDSAKKRIDTDKDLFFYNAPVVILICAKEGRFSVQDCSCAAQNMMLAARSLGLGSCWIGFADVALNKNRKRLNGLGVPNDMYVIATLTVGYPEKFPGKAFPRKKEADVLSWIK